jgi:sec-independent protein translocase protein TatB
MALKLGAAEILLIFIVALVALGPEKLPGYARSLGEMIKSVKGYTGNLTDEVRTNLIEPLNQAQQPLKETLGDPLNNVIHYPGETKKSG